MRKAILAGTIILAGCVDQKPIPVFPADPYFTDLHECVDSLGQTVLVVDPIIDGFYTIEVFPFGVGAINEVGAVEVLGNDPNTIRWLTTTLPVQVVYRAKAVLPWQPASRKIETRPTNGCILV